MKTFKLTRKVQIILATLLVVLAGVIIVGVLSNNMVNASGSVPTCPICTTSANMQLTGSNSSGHTYVCSIHGQTKTEAHNYSSSGHTNTCTLCGYTETTDHTYGSWQYYDESYHIRYCSVCGQAKSESHIYSEGRCTACGYEPHTHTYGSWRYYDESYHIRYCTDCGEADTETHIYSENRCTACGYEPDESGDSGGSGGDSGGSGGSGGSGSGGDSGTTECEHTYEIQHDETNHWEQCSKCNEIKSESTEAHKEGTHENDGKCTVCNYQYQTHGQSTTVNEYTTTENSHTPVYACSYSGCTGTYTGTAEAHTGATHENGGKCTVCDEVYEQHEISDTLKGYTTTETTHTPVYACSYSGCTGIYTGTAEAHTGATHENGGKCTVCDEIYEQHGMSSIIKGYTTTETTHTPVYACVNEGCETTYNGTEENHNVEQWNDNGDGTHSGDCTICNYTVTKEHDYENGKCTDCDAIQPEESCEHSYVLKNSDTQHWEECSKCGEVKSGTLELHRYGTYIDNGDGTHSATCTVCKYKLTEEHNYENGKCTDCDATQPEEPCEHSYVIKNDKTYHWEECSKCGEIKSGSKELHKFGTYVDNKDGTHSATCSVCKYKLTEEHDYENGKCVDCDVTDPNNNDNNNSNNNSGNNNNSDNTNTNANKDDTTAKQEIPKSGIQSTILILISALGVVVIVLGIKMKKYKNI